MEPSGTAAEPDQGASPDLFTRPVECDLIYLSDLRFTGGTSSSLVNEIRAAVAAGYRIGVMQLASSSLRAQRPFHEDLRALIDAGAITLIPHNQAVAATLTIIKHPTLFTYPVDHHMPPQGLGITTDHLVLVVGQVPVDPNGTRYYSAVDVDATITAAFGRAPTWAPVSPMVRAALIAEPGSDTLAFRESDWVEIIDVADWEVERVRPDDAALVIGRHSRDDRLKWPDSAGDILRVYPERDDLTVRILGGISSIADELAAYRAAHGLPGSVPSNWDVLEFGAMSAREFLASIDVHVYFHSSGLTEAFGRATLEALASGAICVLPPHFAPLFGDACLYGEPEALPAILARIRTDPQWASLVRSQSRRSVQDRFSYEAHQARLGQFVPHPGRWREAPAHWVPVPTAVRDQRVGVLFSALGASTDEVTRLLERLAELRDVDDGIRPVMAVTVAAPAQAAALGIPVEVITSRSNYRQHSTAPWPAYAQKRLRGIMRTYDLHQLMVTDLFHPDAWISMRVRRVAS